MRDYTRILSDSMREELLDRFPELVGSGHGADGTARFGGGLESLDGGALGFDVDDAARAIRKMQEGAGEAIDAGLEAIILRFGRPAYFVKNDSFDTRDTPSTSQEIDALVDGARTPIEAALPKVGRVNLRHHRMSWAGTGWIVAPNVVVTNRHVARLFAEADGDGFAFVEDGDGRAAQARLDMVREYRVPRESVFRMRAVLWIEPSRANRHDIAFLSIDAVGEDDQPQPRPIELMSDEEFAKVGPGRSLAVIGYPAFSSYNDREDQQRIFQGVFDVKRLQPGCVSTIADGKVSHDATTLGGNSGSVVLDLPTGKAMALHFGGFEGRTNSAVAAPVVRRVLRERVGAI